MTERTAYPWDDWVKTCGAPTVWCGFDWPEIVENYVVLPASERAMKHIIKNLDRTLVCVVEKDGHMTTVEPGESRILDVREIKTPTRCHFSIEPQP